MPNNNLGTQMRYSIPDYLFDYFPKKIELNINASKSE